jgi:diaminopimelate decarboxylase
MPDPPPLAGAEPSATELHELAVKHGTPFFIYDADMINARIRRIRDSLDHLVQVFYAVKANPNLELLRAVGDTADGFDISSGGELEQAQMAGIEPVRLSFAGPAKTTEELTASIVHGVGYISVECLDELLECADIARRVDRRANVVIRVNPEQPNRSFGLKMGGIAVQFGIDETALGEALKAVAAHAQELSFQGIHIYAGTQNFDAAGVAAGVENTFRIAREVEAASGLTCRTINVGGGFGVAHGEKARELDIDALAAALVPCLRVLHDSSREPRKVVFELGRYLTAPAGTYVARVVHVKTSRGKTFFITDGGLHHHLGAAGTFGTALRSNYVLRNVSRPDAPAVRCNVAGPSCNPTDLLGVDVDLARPERGDLIAVLNAGSYGLTASPVLFLGRPTPAELIRHDGKITLGRRPRTITEFN